MKDSPQNNTKTLSDKLVLHADLENQSLERDIIISQSSCHPYPSFGPNRATLPLSGVNLDTEMIFGERNLKFIAPNNVLPP